MPVSIKREPFTAPTLEVELRVPHVQVLRALMPSNPTDPSSEWPLFSRVTMREVCGLSPTNSMNRILHGIKHGRSAHLGLIGMKLIEEVPLNIDGVTEYNYRITAKGIQCLSHHD